MSLRKYVAVAAVMCSSLVMAGVDTNRGIMFKLDFDKPRYEASIAKGNPRPISSIDGINSSAGLFGNGVTLSNTQALQYAATDNLDFKQGTVSFWLKRGDWDINTSDANIFFYAQAGKQRIMFYKFFSSLRFLVKSANNIAQMPFVNNNTFPAGKWTKIDLVWNPNEIKFYLNGKINDDAQIQPVKLDDQPTTAEGNAYFLFGRPQTPEFKQSFVPFQPQASNEYDDVVIYNRCLSSREIKQNYERHVQPKQTVDNPPMLVIPALDNLNIVNGTPSENDWARSAKTLLLKGVGDASGTAELFHNHNHLFIRLHGGMANSPDKTSFEINLASASGKDSWRIWSGDNGKPQCRLNGETTACPDIKSLPQGGGIVIAISLNILPWTRPGEKFRGNMTLNGKSWAASPDGYGEMLSGKDALAVRLELPPGDLERGVIALKITATGTSGKRKIVHSTAHCGSLAGNLEAYYGGYRPEDLTGAQWNRVLADGDYRLSTESVDDSGHVVQRLVHSFSCDSGFELAYDFLPQKRGFELRMSFHGSTEKIRRQIPSGLDADIALIEVKTGTQVAGERVTVKDLCWRHSFILPDKLFSISAGQKMPLTNLPPGDYYLQVKAGGDTVRKIFRIPDLSIYGQAIEDNHRVPEPWTPVEVTGERTFTVQDRVYSFGDGCLPVQIESLGEKLFNRAPAYRLITDSGVADIRWTGFKVDAKYPDYVVLSGHGNAGDLELTWRGELWFDGMYKWKLELNPVSSLKIKTLRLEWETPVESARHVLKPQYQAWKNDEVRMPFTLRPGGGVMTDDMFWLTGIRTGLVWFGESDANWVKNGPEQIFIRRGKTTVDCRIDLIARDVLLTQKASYTMVLQGTPAKKYDPDWRNINFYDYLSPRSNFANFTAIGWTSEWNWTAPDNLTDWIGILPLYPKAFDNYLKNWNVRNIKPLVYSQPMCLTRNDPHYDYFMNYWQGTKSYPTSTKMYPNRIPFQIYSVNGRADYAADLPLYRMKKLFDDYPGTAGIYFDNCAMNSDGNTENGSGGKDAFGQPYRTSTALGYRDFFMRARKLHQQYGKAFFLHGADLFYPFVHDMGDYWIPGERWGWQNWLNDNNVFSFYCEKVPLAEWQTVYNSRLLGIGIALLPQLDLYGRQKGKNPEFMNKLNSDETTVAMLAPLLLHDVGICNYVGTNARKVVDNWWGVKQSIGLEKAVFHGYWENDAVKSTSPQVYVSRYEWNEQAPFQFQHLLVAANLGASEQPLNLVMDLEKLGLAGKQFIVYDLWNDNEQPAANAWSGWFLSGLKNDGKEKWLDNARIKARNFMLLGIKVGHHNRLVTK